MMRSERRALLCGLYAITPEVDDTSRLLAMVREATKGGAKLVQYRSKRLANDDRVLQATALLRMCRELCVPLIINDDVDLALAIGADGVHLGREDADPRQVRDRVPGMILGVSCYDEPARAAVAAQQGADYVGIGSVFASATKPGAARAGLAAIRAAKEAGGLPVAAIGGIGAPNAGEAVAAGADMIAVISALFGASDIALAARALSKPFDREVSLHAR